jgi:hypothetical protein
MRLASYVPGELIPLPLSGSIPELPMLQKSRKSSDPENLANVDLFRRCVAIQLSGSENFVRHPKKTFATSAKKRLMYCTNAGNNSAYGAHVPVEEKESSIRSVGTHERWRCPHATVYRRWLAIAITVDKANRL